MPDSDKPSVAFLIDRWDPQRGGAERALANFAQFLLARGYRVLAVAEEHAADAPGEPLAISSFGLTRSRRERERARKLVAAAREHGADVTIGCRHLYQCDLYWPHGGAHAATLRQVLRSKGLDAQRAPQGRHRAFLEFERELFERGGARRVACVSELVLDELASEWPAARDRLVLVENGVDLARFRPEARDTLGAGLREELGVAPSTPLLLFAARNPRLKGWVALERALGHLVERSERDWILLAVAPRPLRLPSGRCLWRERLDPLASYLAADLVVQPTWRDTSGLVILEALACGTPVITTRCAGAAALVDAHAGSVLPDPSDPRALGAELADWIGRVRAGGKDPAAIRARVAHLDSQRCHEQLERLVLELAGDARAATS